jgi:hypothetical protein
MPNDATTGTKGQAYDLRQVRKQLDSTTQVMIATEHALGGPRDGEVWERRGFLQRLTRAG